jgi:membrane protease YdiL (CAAX protease family)
MLCIVLASGIFIIVGKLNFINSESDNYILALQAIMTIFMFAVPALIVAYLCSPRATEFLFLNRKSVFFEITAVIGLLIVGVPFINLLTHLNESLAQISIFDELFSATEKAKNAQAEQLISANFWGALAVVALLAAVTEELMFRGAVLRILAEKLNVHLAVWLSAVAFSAIHFQFFGFLPRMVLGAYFAYIVIFSKNIRLSMWAHFFNNAIFIIVFYFYKNNNENTFLDTLGSGGTWFTGIASGILTVAGMIYLMKYWKNTTVTRL